MYPQAPQLQRGVSVIFFKNKPKFRELQPVHRRVWNISCFFFHNTCSSTLEYACCFFFKKYFNVTNVLACLASTGKLFQSLMVEGKKNLLY